ncbi:hypothetical protein I2I11_04215 [Pontibacter sp. 172403-2]|nr:hypothetical protein [Pontibacter sp. 172403-2]
MNKLPTTLAVVLMMFVLLSCQPKEQNKPNSGTRLWHQHELRNAFLDDGMDVKVDVEGDSSDILILSYLLFDDVWDRKFQTNGSYKAWQKMGYKKVILQDEGEDYRHEQDLTIPIVETY